MKLEYNSEYFCLGDEKYTDPEYILTSTTVKDFNEGGKFYSPDIYEFIVNEQIKIFNGDDDSNPSEAPLLQLEVRFDKEISYGEFDFIPVGTQCILLNESTMLVGLWGKVLMAHKVSEDEVVTVLDEEESTEEKEELAFIQWINI